MKNGLPRVAVCFPSGDMVHADFALALAGLCNASADFELSIINNKSSIVAVARNNAVANARDFHADYLLFLDSDMVFPRSTLHRLISHREDIAGATYTKRVPPFSLLGTALDGEPVCDARLLTEMKTLPAGCLLIKMSVFDALREPYFRFLNDETTGLIHGEDYVFCARAREAGFRIWCDMGLSLEIGHIGQKVYRHGA